MYSKLTSNTTGLLGATLGLPGADVRPFGNANYPTEICVRDIVYRKIFINLEDFKSIAKNAVKCECKTDRT